MNTLKEINGRYYQEAEVVMLATKNHTKLYLSKYGVLSQVHKDRNQLRYEQEGYKPQHIYILSSDKIKEGDWMLVPTVNTDYIDYSKCIPLKAKYDYANSKYTKKIIATTDESLTILVTDRTDCYMILSKPSDYFIKKYIEEYNKGNQITDILVEYSPKEYKIGDKVHIGGKDWEVDIKVEWSELFKGFYFGTRNGGTWKCFEYELKVDSDNTITIKKVKDSYSREELIKILHKSLDANTTKHPTLRQVFVKQLNDWIEENL
mgnify:CR=1 FL=1